MSPMNKVAEFFRTEYKRLVRFVRYLIEDAADRDAEDIVQDVMVNIFNKADFTLPIEHLSAYIYQSLRNKVIDIFRKKKDMTSLSELIHDVRSDTVREFERKEIHELIFQEISSLSDEERAVVVATEFDDRSFQELAREWNVPLGTLLSRKSRALQKMRKRLTGLV